ncbi:retrovirus-related pol polyprotein from transposon TNT 1-94 [Tanacetum coccineum]
MASMNTRLNIVKLDGNIVLKLGGSKQVGFKQLGPGVETGVHGVSNDDTAVAQRRLEDKVILSLTACEDYELEQLDVKMAFLHGNLEETIYMRQPPGFEEGTGNKEFAPGMYIYLLLYVDDMLIACKSKSEIEYTKGLLRLEFDMKELVQLGRYLVWRSQTCFYKQSTYHLHTAIDICTYVVQTP